MKKPVITLAISSLLAFSTTASAHPNCPKLGFWGKTPEECVPHKHEEVTLAGAEEKHIVYFSFDSAEVTDIQDITSYIDTLKELNSVVLIGHADRLGSDDYNLRLSKQRVDAVETALISNGVAASKISTDYKGESVPAKSCEDTTHSELIECLFANRRVEIEIVGEKVIENAAN